MRLAFSVSGSLPVPDRLTDSPSATVWSAPAAAVGASFAPVMVMVTLPSVPSAAAMGKVSVTLVSFARASVASLALSRVYVQVPAVLMVKVP